MDGVTARLGLQRFEQDFLRLRIAPVRHIDVCFSHRIDTFVSVDRRQRGLAEIGLDRTGAGIDALAAARCADHRRRGRRCFKARRGRRRCVLSCLAGLRLAVPEITQDEQQHGPQPAQRLGIREQSWLFRFHGGFGFRRRNRCGDRLRRFHLGWLDRHRRLDRLLCRLLVCESHQIRHFLVLGFGRIGCEIRHRLFGRRDHRRRSRSRSRRWGRSGRRRRRRNRRCCRLLLSLCHRGVLQFDQLLQLPHVSFEIGQTAVGVLERAFLGNHLFFKGTDLAVAFRSRLRHPDLVGCRRCRRCAIVDPRLDLAGGGTTAGVCRRCRIGHGTRQASAIGREVAGLGHHDLARFLRRHGLRSGLIRNGENAPGTQAIHVAVVEGFGIRLDQCHEHLVQADAGRNVLACDTAQRIAAFHLIGVVGGCARRRDRRPGHCTGLCTPDDNRVDRRLSRHVRRIEQEGVFADELAGRPVELDQDIKIRLVDHPLAGHDQHRARTALFHCDLDAAQTGGVFDAGLLEGAWRREPCGHRSQFVRAGGQLDFCTEGLSDRGLDSKFAQTGCAGCQRER